MSSGGSIEQIIVKEFGAEIKRKDIMTLKGTSWLNDEVFLMDSRVSTYFNT